MGIDDFIKKYLNKEYIQGQNSNIEIWNTWYKGKSNDFHEYQVYNGENYVKKDKKSLCMGKKVCADWASLLLSEKTDIVIDEKDTIDELFKNIKFWKKANKAVEQSFALGIGALVVNVKNISINKKGKLINNKSGKLNVDFVNGLRVYPITVVDGEIIECAFYKYFTGGVNISIHLIGKDGNYEIHNIVGHGKDDKYEYDNAMVFNTLSNLPWFKIITPNDANNIDIDDEVGISILANSIDILKTIDDIFDTFDNEFVQGKKRTFVSARALKIKVQDGETIRVFDPNDTTFYVLPEDEDGKNYVNTDNSDLRSEQLIAGLQKALDLLAFNCGLGTGYYKFEFDGLKTATEVITEHSDTFRNIKKHEIILEEVLQDITKVIMYASNTFCGDNFKLEQDIQVKFDDSIIEDKSAERNMDKLDVNLGVMSKLEYRMKWYAETEEKAKQAIELALKEIKEGNDKKDAITAENINGNNTKNKNI